MTTFHSLLVHHISHDFASCDLEAPLAGFDDSKNASVYIATAGRKKPASRSQPVARSSLLYSNWSQEARF
jgi:hypothetical protein